MVYTDGAHLVADSLEELRAYADKVKLNWDWLHLAGKNLHPHFDICGHVRQKVLNDEAVKLVSKKEIIRLCRLNFRQPTNAGEVKEWEEHHQRNIEDMQLPTEDDFARMFANIKRQTGL